MDFEEKRFVTGYELGPEERDIYRKGIEALEGCENAREGLKILSDIFKSLGESTYFSNRSIEWAGELIDSYRNLGEILKSLIEMDPDNEEDPDDEDLSGLESRLERFEERF